MNEEYDQLLKRLRNDMARERNVRRYIGDLIIKYQMDDVFSTHKECYDEARMIETIDTFIAELLEKVQS